jgi:hypothetical protein
MHHRHQVLHPAVALHADLGNGNLTNSFLKRHAHWPWKNPAAKQVTLQADIIDYLSKRFERDVERAKKELSGDSLTKRIQYYYETFRKELEEVKQKRKK